MSPTETERQPPEQRDQALLARLPALLAAVLRHPGWRQHLGAIDPAAFTTRAALATLPVLRKSALPALQRANPPFGGLRTLPEGGRVFASPGPIYEIEGPGPDPWNSARAFRAAGFHPGDLVLNTLGYTLTPGGLILDSGARAAGCTTIPAGPGNTAQQVDLIRHLRPTGYAGTPDFLKILLDTAGEPTSITKALVSGAAFPPSLQAEIAGRNIAAYQAYATADLGVVAYESEARDGLLVNEDLLVEILRPGSPTPLDDGEVGEIVVTSFSPHTPWIRLALGDLSKTLPGLSPCGRTAPRLNGWMGRADQATKIRGMFIRPEQLAELATRMPSLGRHRIVVSRQGEQDRLQLHAEIQQDEAETLARHFQDITKLKAEILPVPPNTLPTDGLLIQDDR